MSTTKKDLLNQKQDTISVLITTRSLLSQINRLQLQLQIVLLKQLNNRKLFRLKLQQKSRKLKQREVTSCRAVIKK